ncbi:MAG: hypothetical protein HFE62_05990 [Firmicutes bacterium]|nr:hypothetical protein [Bacillota bacterium]
MIKKISGSADKSTEKLEKILVCVTNRENPKEIINEGARIANEKNGELHIIYVQQGKSVFGNKKNFKFMEELFGFASEKGGMVHFYCDTDILECIKEFVKENEITKVVVKEAAISGEHAESSLMNILRGAIRFIYNPVEIFVV